MQDRIGNAQLKEMLAKLDVPWSRISGTFPDIEEDEWRDLVGMWRAHTDAGHELIAWH